jgi:hypothetical protein
MNEREEFAAIVERANGRIPPLSHEQTLAKIERGFLQSEHGEVVDGESYVAGLLAELDVLERKRGSAKTKPAGRKSKKSKHT